MQKQTNKKTNSDCYEFGIGVHTQRFPHLFSQYLQWRVLPYCCVFTRPSHKEGGRFNMLTVCLFDCFFFKSVSQIGTLEALIGHKSAILRRWLVRVCWFILCDARKDSETLPFILKQSLILSNICVIIERNWSVIQLDKAYNNISWLARTIYNNANVLFVFAIFCDISKASENLTFILNKVLFCPVFVLLL